MTQHSFPVEKTLSGILDKNSWNAPLKELRPQDCYGTDKNASHDYINGFYEKEFIKYKYKKISLLEIGFCYGTSLHLWKEYFSQASIVGIDHADRLNEVHRNIEGVTHIFKNGYSQTVADILGDFDIIIDDGPHTLESQIMAINLYLPKLKKDGVFIVEDVQDYSYFQTLTNAVPEQYKNKIECIDLRGNKDRYDDLMFVIRN